MPDRLPLWLVGTFAVLGVLTVLGVFIWGSYVGPGAPV
ncbi:photosystem II reaction center protein J [Candidatus Cyanaurora vandensis]|nr:photosystem II reaction center protein J [Candidatus Cyanaurora vandensis]